jgi:phosphatidate phosphatase APP1
MTESPPPRRTLHVAARIERAAQSLVEPRLRRRGWRPAVVPYTGYGADGWVRVLARVLLLPPDWSQGEARDVRGWRAFLTAEPSGVPVQVRLADRTHVVRSRRDGYVDVRLPADLAAGWATAQLSVEGRPPVEAALRIAGSADTLGLVSDIDDTVIVTMLPRPLLAFWNAFVLKGSARRPVPGMAELYRSIANAHPELVVVYLSTGAWNTAPTIRAFLERHGFPPGPLLMTDWGPTRERWFRSGPAHKLAELRRLLEDMPHVRWLLVGDDGQHDPSIYAEIAWEAPDSVEAVAIRQLSTGEQVLTHGSPNPRDGEQAPRSVDHEVRAPDGYGLREELRRRGLLGGPG